jgi:DNA (cytosine-5)-methyltransferase 1
MIEDGNTSDVTTPVVKVVDLFCGAGGLAFGLKTAGLTVAAGVDLDGSCQYAFEENCGGEFSKKSVVDLTAQELEGWFAGADVRVLAGCAPCQPFSTYSQSRKSKDDRWTLLNQFKRLAIETLPEIVTMENVLGLSGQEVWSDFVSALEEKKYYVSWSEVDCTRLGIPQSRKRLVLIASRLGPISLSPTVLEKTKTVKDVIGELPRIDAGEANPNDPLHVAASLSPLNLERIKISKPGGTWRDWPEDLRAACHRKKSGKTYPSVYGRMEWGKPSPTMTTQCYGFGNGRFGHPEQDRAISLREAAILQSFPADYKFIAETEVVSFSKLGTLIGNAVPPKLGEAIGVSIVAHLTAQSSDSSETNTG